MHSLLILIKVVFHNGNAPRAKQLLLQHLLDCRNIGAHANANEAEVGAGRQKVAALDAARRLNLTNNRYAQLQEAVLHNAHFPRTH